MSDFKLKKWKSESYSIQKKVNLSVKMRISIKIRDKYGKERVFEMIKEWKRGELG